MPPGGAELRLVGAAPAEPAAAAEARGRDAAEDAAPEDAVQALLLAREGYQAAVDAVEGVTLPSLTDFVD